MSAAQPQYWFRAKRLGWGWGWPATWQGWVVLATWMAVVLVVSPPLAVRSFVLFFVFITGMAAAIFAVCYVKGEPLRWRWGKDCQR